MPLAFLNQPLRLGYLLMTISRLETGFMIAVHAQLVAAVAQPVAVDTT